MNRIIYGALMLVIAGLQGCCNQYSTFYHDNLVGVPGGRTAYVEFYTGEPKAINGTTPEIDNKNMFENGNMLLGYSSFDGPKGPVEDAVRVAKDKGAEFLIYYANYINSVSGSYTYSMQNPNQTIISNSSGNINSNGAVYGNGGSLNYYGNTRYNGTTSTVIPGGYTSYNIPYTINRYNYLATYWAKIPVIHFGVASKDLPDDVKHELQRNKGAIVTMVVKNSPAFNANILTGDILLKFNGKDIVDTADLSSNIKNYYGKNVRIEYLRGSETREIDILLN